MKGLPFGKTEKTAANLWTWGPAPSPWPQSFQFYQTITLSFTPKGFEDPGDGAPTFWEPDPLVRNVPTYTGNLLYW